MSILYHAEVWYGSRLASRAKGSSFCSPRMRSRGSVLRWIDSLRQSNRGHKLHCLICVDCESYQTFGYAR